MSANPAADAVLSLARSQHDKLARLLDDVASAGLAERKAAMAVLEDFLSAHQKAEETYLGHASKNPDNLQTWVERLNELDFNSTAFPRRFAAFRAELLSHTRDETRHTIPDALDTMSDSQLETVRMAFEGISRAARTSP